MIKINRLDHINITTAHYPETLEFYKKHFGFKTFEAGTYNGREYEIIGLSGVLFLCIYQGESLKKEGLLNHIGFHVDDFDSVYRYSQESDIEIVQDITQYPESRSFYIQDPGGLEIEISEKFAGGLG